MNYKKYKQTNQSQKRYKLENNLIILRDSIKNLTYLTILTIIVLLRDTCFKKCLYTKDIYEFLGKDCKESIIRKVLLKYFPRDEYVRIHHEVCGSKRHCFIVHKSVLDSYFCKAYVRQNKKGEYYIRLKNSINIMRALEEHSKVELFLKIKKKKAYHKEAMKVVKTLFFAWMKYKKSHSSIRTDSLITLKSYINSNIFFKKDKDRKVAHNIYQNDKKEKYKKREKYTFEDWKITLLKISQRIDMSNVDMRLFTEPKIYFDNKRPLTYERSKARTIDLDKRQQIRLYKSKKDLANNTLKFKSTSRVSDVSVDSNLSKLGDIFDKMCYNFVNN
jgi:hypothetical protein